MKCPDCPRKFKSKDTLNEHLICVHNNVKNEKCAECKATFKNQTKTW